jgi:hypothetical protein
MASSRILAEGIDFMVSEWAGNDNPTGRPQKIIRHFAGIPGLAVENWLERGFWDRALFAESFLEGPDNGHQDSAPDSAAQDIGDDAPDVRAGAARIPEPQRVQELAAQTAAQNAKDRVEHRTQGEFFEKAAGQISPESAADQLNDQIHRVLHDASVSGLLITGRDLPPSR